VELAPREEKPRVVSGTWGERETEESDNEVGGVVKKRAEGRRETALCKLRGFRGGANGAT